jgi:hypothetical protein
MAAQPSPAILGHGHGNLEPGKGEKFHLRVLRLPLCWLHELAEYSYAGYRAGRCHFFCVAQFGNQETQPQLQLRL